MSIIERVMTNTTFNLFALLSVLSFALYALGKGYELI
ncbi:Uncharacterised protein [Candidatus Venteria ishoeyi]|uniref:Uncharacterized protein n=1 Tax=Candidatus Venteria ishoeyi TaxID=1899563 RepID=A0A1H6FB01_9GAMM|nr:Uncharacterised protein [Candidatus Venteria ishoeyi]